MCDTAAYLVDHRLPEAPYRQWVLTVPWVLRYRLSVDRKLPSRVLDGFLRTIFAWQHRQGRGIRGTVAVSGRLPGAPGEKSRPYLRQTIRRLRLRPAAVRRPKYTPLETSASFPRRRSQTAVWYPPGSFSPSMRTATRSP
jgi:hypothetical protein